jgi:YVTN family beta-propeller protein
MRAFYVFFMPFLLVITVSTGARALNYQINTIPNLGMCLSAPIIYGGFIIAKSCSAKHVSIINAENREVLKQIDLNFEPTIQHINLGSATIKFIELEHEIILLQDIKTHKLILVSGGKHQSSPRLAPPQVIVDNLKFTYTYESSTLWVEAENTESRQSSGRTLISQRTLAMTNIIGDFDYSVIQGKIRATNNMTREIIMVESGPIPSALVKVDEQYLVTSNWGDDTVSIIDRASHKLVKTIPVGRHPIKPVVAHNKIYISNFGDGSISVIEIAKTE